MLKIVSGKKIFFVLIAIFLLSSPCLAGEWNLTGSLNQGRSQFCSVLLEDGRVLVAGGCNSGELSSCEIYDPDSGEWSTTDSMHCLRRDFSLTKLSNGKILATGGYNGGVGPSTTTSEIFDPQTVTWTTSAELNYFRGHHTAVFLQNNKVLIVGGDAVNSYKGCEIYDPETGIFSLTAFCSYPKTNHTAELLPDGRVMAIGGGNSSYEHCEIYDPDTELWIEIDDLNESRYSHTSHLLPNGNVIAIAGRHGNHYNNSCEIYDFQTEEWTFTDSLEIGRTGHCSEFLLKKEILVMSGQGEVGSGSAYSCEIYDYLTNEWQTAASLTGSKTNGSSEILEDERVLAIGQYICEIYTWNYMPVVSQPQGPNQGITGDVLIFSVTASDPDNDSIAVRIDWGDGEISEWIELQPSGSTFELSHDWLEPGVYEIRAQSADQWFFLNPLCHNSLSEWGDTLLVIIIPGPSIDPSYNTELAVRIYPNPFSTSTTISLWQANLHPDTVVPPYGAGENARIEIYNIKGQMVKTFTMFPSGYLGTRDVVWDGRDDKNQHVGSGIYLYKLMMGEKEIASNKMLLLK